MESLQRQLDAARGSRRVAFAAVWIAMSLFAGSATLAAPAGATARLGHGYPHAVQYAPDGELLAVATRIGVGLWDTRTLDRVAFLDARSSVQSIAFSRDGATLATGLSNGTTKIWDIGSRQELATIVSNSEYVRSVAFSPDGTVLAIGGNQVTLWDAHTGQTIRTVSMGGWSVAFSPDGATLAGGGSAALTLWDMRTGQEKAEVGAHSGVTRSVAFSPDGVTLASGGDDGKVRLWDADTLLDIATLPVSGFGGVDSVAYAADGATLASGGGSLMLWDTQSRQDIATLHPQSSSASSVAFSPDGKTLASVGYDARVTLWDTRSGLEVARLPGHGEDVTVVAFARDGATLMGGSDGGRVRFWDTFSLQNIATLRRHGSGINGLALSPDGAALVVSERHDSPRVWDMSSREVIATLATSGSVKAAAFSPDGATTAVAIWGDVTLWSTSSWQTAGTLDGRSSNIRALAFSPDGTTLAAGYADGTVVLWDTGTWLRAATLRGHSRDVTSVAFSPDGATIATGSWDKTVRVWDAHTWIEFATLRGHTGVVWSVAFSPDGGILASGGSDPTVKLWAWQARHDIATLVGHTSAVRSVAFSPSESILASGSLDGTIVLWDTSPHVPSPDFAQRSSWVSDPTGNGDGAASPGERVALRARMRNEGERNAEDVHVTLTVADPDVTVVSAEATHTAWPVGEARNNLGFVLDIAPDASAHDVTVVVDVTARVGGPWQFTYTFPIVRPAYEFTKRTTWLFDPTPRGNKDGVANPGERIQPRIRLRNDGPGDAENVRVTVATSDSDVMVANGEVLHATWPEGVARNSDGLVLDIAPDATSHSVTLAVEVTSDGGGLWQFEFVFPIVAPSPEFTRRNAWLYEPTASTRNGQADVGERVHPRVRLRNDGPADAENVTVTLTTDDPDITIINGSVSHAAWSAGSVLNNNGLTLDIASNATSHEATVTVEVTADNGGPWEFTFTLPIVAPTLTFTKRSAWVFEPTATTRNGQADAGERVYPRVRMKNDGPEDAENVTVTLSTDDPDVTVVNGTATHATWPVGVARNNGGLVLDISPDATSHEAVVTVDVTADSAGPWQFTFSFPVAAGAPTFVKRNAWIYDPTPRADKDGVAEPGERVRPRIRLRNDGPADAVNVRATLSITDDDVTVVRAEETHATWPAGAARTIVGFVLDIAKGATAHEVTAVVDVTMDGADAQQFSFTFPIVPGPPEFTLRSSWVYDPLPGGNRNGVADAGESVLTRVRLLNSGQTEAENVVVTLSTQDANVTVAGATVSHATWPAGVARNNNGLGVEIGAEAAGSVWFTVIVTAENGGHWQFEFDIAVEAAAAPVAVTAFRPATTALLPNYPNPFNPETWIPFDLSEAGDVTVRVYDMQGREVRRLVLGRRDAGAYRRRAAAAYWDGRNESGEPVASGVYVYELRTREFSERRRLVIRK